MIKVNTGHVQRIVLRLDKHDHMNFSVHCLILVYSCEQTTFYKLLINEAAMMV